MGLMSGLSAWLSYAAMLFWLWATLLVCKGAQLYLDRQRKLSVDDEAVRDYIIRRLDSEVLADRIAEKVASRLRAEENGGADNARIA